MLQALQSVVVLSFYKASQTQLQAPRERPAEHRLNPCKCSPDSPTVPPPNWGQQTLSAQAAYGVREEMALKQHLEQGIIGNL